MPDAASPLLASLQARFLPRLTAAVRRCLALRDAAGTALRVVLMSGFSHDEMAAALARTGADAGVSKHDGTRAIVRAVRGVLG